MITIVGCVIVEHGHTLSLASHLPGIPEPSSPSFSTSFFSFSVSQDWHLFVSDVVSLSLSLSPSQSSLPHSCRPE